MAAPSAGRLLKKPALFYRGNCAVFRGGYALYWDMASAAMRLILQHVGRENLLLTF
jgi:hypothetical protein